MVLDGHESALNGIRGKLVYLNSTPSKLNRLFPAEKDFKTAFLRSAIRRLKVLVPKSRIAVIIRSIAKSLK